MDKVFPSADEAVADIADGSSIAVGGLGLAGIPAFLIEALLAHGPSISPSCRTNCGVDGAGLGLLLAEHRISRAISSYVGENREFARRFLAGEIQLELTPQGTPAERLRAGGAGIPAFYTATGVGTQVAGGGLAGRYAPDGSIAMVSPPKDIRVFDGREYVLGRVDRSDLCAAGATVATHNRRQLGADGYRAA